MAHLTHLTQHLPSAQPWELSLHPGAPALLAPRVPCSLICPPFLSFPGGPFAPSCQGPISCPSASPGRLDGTLSQAGLRGHPVSQKAVHPPFPRQPGAASSCCRASPFLACFLVFFFFPGTPLASSSVRVPS